MGIVKNAFKSVGRAVSSVARSPFRAFVHIVPTMIGASLGGPLGAGIGSALGSIASGERGSGVFRSALLGAGTTWAGNALSSKMMGTNFFKGMAPFAKMAGPVLGGWAAFAVSEKERMLRKQAAAAESSGNYGADVSISSIEEMHYRTNQRILELMRANQPKYFEPSERMKKRGVERNTRGQTIQAAVERRSEHVYKNYGSEPISKAWASKYLPTPKKGIEYQRMISSIYERTKKGGYRYGGK